MTSDSLDKSLDDCVCDSLDRKETCFSDEEIEFFEDTTHELSNSIGNTVEKFIRKSKYNDLFIVMGIITPAHLNSLDNTFLSLANCASSNKDSLIELVNHLHKMIIEFNGNLQEYCEKFFEKMKIEEDIKKIVANGSDGNTGEKH
jgi:hypothetical protein